ncbi:MAG: hypothetical protein K2P46_02935, partial [Alistipes sp.]|nr:hypothetical protein [Alistipes sp.]
MKGSKILDNCGFIILLHSSLDTQFTMQEQMLLDLEYDRFLFRYLSGTPNKTPRICFEMHFYSIGLKIKFPVNQPFTGNRFSFHCTLAEREGFEPPVQLPVHRISSAARS